MQNKFADCYGCVEFEENKCASEVPPEFIKNKRIIYCPCRKCLVKPICVEPCEKYFLYVNVFIGDKQRSIDI